MTRVIKAVIVWTVLSTLLLGGLLAVVSLVLCSEAKAIEDQRSKTDTTRQVIAWRLYYQDSTRVRVTDSLGWILAPTTNVAVIEEIYVEAYRYWNNERNRFELRNYRRLLHSKDFYWRVFPRGYLWGGALAEIPPGLPTGTVKTGAVLIDDALRRIYDWAWDDREREVDSLPIRPEKKR